MVLEGLDELCLAGWELAARSKLTGGPHLRHPVGVLLAAHLEPGFLGVQLPGRLLLSSAACHAGVH